MACQCVRRFWVLQYRQHLFSEQRPSVSAAHASFAACFIRTYAGVLSLEAGVLHDLRPRTGGRGDLQKSESLRTVINNEEFASYVPISLVVSSDYD